MLKAKKEFKIWDWEFDSEFDFLRFGFVNT